MFFFYSFALRPVGPMTSQQILFIKTCALLFYISSSTELLVFLAPLKNMHFPVCSGEAYINSLLRVQIWNWLELHWR